MGSQQHLGLSDGLLPLPRELTDLLPELHTHTHTHTLAWILVLGPVASVSSEQASPNYYCYFYCHDGPELC